jgi:hypothetical protein
MLLLAAAAARGGRPIYRPRRLVAADSDDELTSGSESAAAKPTSTAGGRGGGALETGASSSAAASYSAGNVGRMPSVGSKRKHGGAAASAAPKRQRLDGSSAARLGSTVAAHTGDADSDGGASASGDSMAYTAGSAIAGGSSRRGRHWGSSVRGRRVAAGAGSAAAGGGSDSDADSGGGAADGAATAGDRRGGARSGGRGGAGSGSRGGGRGHGGRAAGHGGTGFSTGDSGDGSDGDAAEEGDLQLDPDLRDADDGAGAAAGEEAADTVEMLADVMASEPAPSVGQQLRADAARLKMTLAEYLVSGAALSDKTMDRYRGLHSRYLALLVKKGYDGKKLADVPMDDAVDAAVTLFEDLVINSPKGGRSAVVALQAAIRLLYDAQNASEFCPFNQTLMPRLIKSLRARLARMNIAKGGQAAPRYDRLHAHSGAACSADEQRVSS